MNTSLPILLILVISSVNGQWFFSAPAFNWQPFQTTTTEAPPPPQYVEHFKRMGYETDDKGNVWVGNDDAKLLIIARSSYP